eukprot:TRINITY_DN284_c1_g1_i1.p1 TRINITY_DN284_c1_g1~~TRINITY_DN284_c1_g1_i1.p1  ORF type:complete len:790 (+),score=189.64 TRINITY_DN284_c1_g1_i1:122-2491(+)
MPSDDKAKFTENEENIQMNEMNAKGAGNEESGGNNLNDYSDDEDDEVEDEDEEDEMQMDNTQDEGIIGEYSFEDGKLKNLAPSEGEDVVAGRWKSQGPNLRRRKKVRDQNEAPSEANVKIDIPETWETGESVRGWSTLLIVCVGLIAGGISIAIDIAVTNFGTARSKLIAFTPSVGWGFVIWTAFLIVLLFISVAITILIAPSVAGSGLAGLKCVVNGAKLDKFLSWRALFVKVFGLVFGLGSGMIVGKEGPFVHLCAILSTCLVRTPLFRPIRRNRFLLQAALGAACATGVAAHFGAPVGGVLFSIEITSTYYPTRNYIYGYLGAIVGAATWRYARNAYYYGTPGFGPLILTPFSSLDIRFGLIELCIFVLLGLVSGLVGTLFIQINASGFRFLRWVKKKNPIFANPFFVAFIIGSMTAVCTYPRFLGQWASLPAANGFSDMINANADWTATDPRVPLNASDWLNRNIFLNLFMYFITRLALIPISILLPIPCGLFVPSLVLGGSLGRFFGEAAYRFLPPSHGALFETYSVIVPGVYAMVGAAAVTASITRTLSVAVIVFEITNNNIAIIPVLVAVITGISVSKFLSLYGIYESIAKLKGLPYLPDLHQDSYSTKAKDMMDTNVVFLTRAFERDEVEKALETAKGEYVFPVVHDKKSKLLVGTIDLLSLQELKRRYDCKEEPSSPELKKSRIQKVKKKLEDIGKDDVKLDKEKKKRKKQKGKHQKVIVKTTPVRFMEMHPIYQVHLLFVVMRLTHGFVVRNGKLKGVITRNKLRDTIYELDKKSTLIH